MNTCSRPPPPVARRPVEAGGKRRGPRRRVVGERRPAPRASRTDGRGTRAPDPCRNSAAIGCLLRGKPEGFHHSARHQGHRISKARLGGPVDNPIWRDPQLWSNRAPDRPSPGRARVGAANGRNPISIVAPCHRVVGASGALTGFAGGLDAKRYLLDLEAPGRHDGHSSNVVRSRLFADLR